jgi:hypothetical protein
LPVPEASRATDRHWEQEVKMQECWYGDLPSPHDNAYLHIDKEQINFYVAGQSAPAAQIVTVTNMGPGTLTKVETSVSPSSSWLTVAVQGNGGNTQTIENSVNMANLPAGEAQATVTVKNGGATNEVSYIVNFFPEGAFPAPSNLQTSETGNPGDTKGSVYLQWTDNTNDETGFIIERKLWTNSYTEVARTDANTTTYTDTDLEIGEYGNYVYTYRVRAYKTGKQSLWSNESTVQLSGQQSITVTAPGAGETVKAGSQYTITWTDNKVNNVKIELSTDGGLTFETITKLGGIVQGDAQWRKYTWEVPQIECDNAVVNVVEYTNDAIRGSSGVFAISSSVNAAAPSVAGNIRIGDIAYTHCGKSLRFRATGNSIARVRLLTAKGTVVAQRLCSRAGQSAISTAGLASGVYMLEIVAGETVKKQAVLLSR